MDIRSPPNAAIRYGIAIQDGSIALMAATGSEAVARVGSPAVSSEPSEISSTSGIPAPKAEAVISREPRTERGR